MRNATIGIWAALFAAHAGCMDLDLLDELIPMGGDGGAASTDGAGEGDADGDTEGDGPPATDAADVTAPAIVETECGAAETASGGVCVAPGNGAASLRLATDEPAALTITAPEGARAEVLSAPWATSHLVAVAGIAAADAGVGIEISDVNGNAAAIGLPVAVPSGPTIAITEVLADPLGEEPAQEFVEIANYGAAAVDLSGWMIDDGGDCNGDFLPAGTALGAGAVALLVSSSFDPASTADPAPAEGALLVTLESSIGTSGLSNADAETIELYDAYGALVSAYDARLGKPVEGASAARLSAELPDGCPAAFGTAPRKPSTPGIAPFVP